MAVVLSESEYGLHYAESLDESKESFEIINRQSKRIKEMIGQILDLSKLENQAKLVKTNHIALLKGCFYLGSQYNYKFLL